MSHRYGDERIAEWLEENGYHPRSPKHGSASCQFFLDDLLHESDPFKEAAKKGEVVYCEDYTVGAGESEWNTDLVIGPPAGDVTTPVFEERPIVEAEPEQVWLAIDAKSVMTEHSKARRNRQRDINSFADIMHLHHPGAVTGGLLLVNSAERFRSPLRDEGDVTEHERIEQLVTETIDIFRDIDRAEGEINPSVDGVGCVVVEHTNVDDGEATTLVDEPPAPQPGDIVHYKTFLHNLIETFEERWLVGETPEITDASKSEDLQVVLEHRVVELAHMAHEVGEAIDEDKDLEDRIAKLTDEIEQIEAVVDVIKQRHSSD